jgi:flavodoxin
MSLSVQKQNYIEIQVRKYSEIPKEILKNLDKMGVDTKPLLNKYESAYFNVLFKDSLNRFDFTNKNIAFLLAGSKSSKKKYFDNERERFHNESTTISSTVYIFNTTQKEKSGGYDAAIVYWSKFIIPHEKLIDLLKKNN